MDKWETPQGGDVKVLATGLYIEGEFLEDTAEES